MAGCRGGAPHQLAYRICRFAGAGSRRMRESRHGAAVSPSPRAAASGWVLEAVFPNGKQATITGFGTRSEANEWLGSARYAAWLRNTRIAFSLSTIVAAFECLSWYAAILTAAAFEFLHSARRAWSNVSVCWSCILYRCLFAATVALVMVSAVVAILAAAVAPLGRSEGPATFAPTPQIRAARPLAQARADGVAEVSDPIADLIDRVSSSDAAMEPPAGVLAVPHNRQQENVKLPPDCSPAALFQSHDRGCWIWNKGEIPRWFLR
jgi:hypothetical protein